MSDKIQLKLSDKNVFEITDEPGGGILIKNSSGAFIQVNDQGITISNGMGAEITLKGPKVDVNGGALSVI